MMPLHSTARLTNLDTDWSQAACENARSQVAALIGALDPKDVIFTSGGTESVNWAIKVTH